MYKKINQVFKIHLDTTHWLFNFIKSTNNMEKKKIHLKKLSRNLKLEKYQLCEIQIANKVYIHSKNEYIIKLKIIKNHNHKCFKEIFSLNVNINIQNCHKYMNDLMTLN